jgi:hypothetical protein
MPEQLEKCVEGAAAQTSPWCQRAEAGDYNTLRTSSVRGGQRSTARLGACVRQWLGEQTNSAHSDKRPNRAELGHERPALHQQGLRYRATMCILIIGLMS